jgi:hypothetical protein
VDDLALRLAALEPEVGAMLRAVGHVDALLVARAGLHDLLRAAVELTGCAARFSAPALGLVVRAGADGVLEPSSGEIDAQAPIPPGSRSCWTPAPTPPTAGPRRAGWAGPGRLQLALHLRRAARSREGWRAGRPER